MMSTSHTQLDSETGVLSGLGMDTATLERLCSVADMSVVQLPP